MTKQLSVNCPICRKNTQLNENDTYELPNNYYILQMMAKKNSSLSRPQKPTSNLYTLFKNIYNEIRFLKNMFYFFKRLFMQPTNKNELWCLRCEVFESQLKKIIEKRIELKCNYNLVFVALKVVENALKKLDGENDLRHEEMVSLLKSVENTKLNLAIGEDENVQSLTKKVKEYNQIITKEQEEFQRLEEPFLSTINDIKDSAQLANSEEELDEHKITLPIASHILFTLLKPVTDKLDTSIPSAEVERPLPKLVPKPRSTGFQRWVPGSTTLLNKFRLQNLVTSASKDSSLQTQKTAVRSVPIPESVTENEAVNPLESYRSPPPVPSRSTSSSSPTVVPSTGNVQPPGTNSTTIQNPLPNPDSLSRPYSRFSWAFPVSNKFRK